MKLQYTFTKNDLIVSSFLGHFLNICTNLSLYAIYLHYNVTLDPIIQKKTRFPKFFVPPILLEYS